MLKMQRIVMIRRTFTQIIIALGLSTPLSQPFIYCLKKDTDQYPILQDYAFLHFCIW